MRSKKYKKDLIDLQITVCRMCVLNRKSCVDDRGACNPCIRCLYSAPADTSKLYHPFRVVRICRLQRVYYVLVHCVVTSIGGGSLALPQITGMNEWMEVIVGQDHVNNMSDRLYVCRIPPVFPAAVSSSSLACRAKIRLRRWACSLIALRKGLMRNGKGS